MSYFQASQALELAMVRASSRLATGFTRAMSKFPIVNYGMLVPSQSQQGYYERLINKYNQRLRNKNAYVWPDGAYRPNNAEEGLQGVAKSYQAVRYNYSMPALGDLAAQQLNKLGGIDLPDSFLSGIGTKAMRARTTRAITALTTASAWTTAANSELNNNHTDTATNLGGGKWDVGTSTAPYLKQGLSQIQIVCNQDTDGILGNQPGNWWLIVNPNTARLMGKSGELVDYMKSSVYSLEAFQGVAFKNQFYGLPPMIYGFNLLIEDTYSITSAEGAASQTAGYVLADNVALVLYKPVDESGNAQVVGDGMSIQTQTFSMFYYAGSQIGQASGSDIQIESSRPQDGFHRLTEIAATENIAEVVTCPASGFYVTAVTG